MDLTAMPSHANYVPKHNTDGPLDKWRAATPDWREQLAEGKRKRAQLINMAASVLSISKKLDEIDEGARDNRLGKLGRLLLFEPAHSERVEGGPVPPTWAELIWMTMIQKAIGGDVRAADWCASQAFGKPSSAVGMSLRSNNITIIDDMAPHTTDRPPGQNEPPLPSDVSEPQNSTLTPVNAPERD